ncbi:MAG: DUF2974 domain-containing protein [Faecousia sp.]
MTNVLDYLKWRGDLSFLQDPPNAVDALIFSALAYIRYGGAVEEKPEEPVTLREAANAFLERGDYAGRIRAKNDLELLRLAGQSTRFGLSKICGYTDRYIPEEETQFAAMSFLLDDGTAFLAFRGTDETLVGWKEDFNMSFQETIPSQRLAQQYIAEFAQRCSLPMRICGHSKGGNLAVFGAARSPREVQERILEVYNNDGPGFTEFLMGDQGYREIVPRIRTFVPQSSVIGMLLEHEEPYTIIRSNQVSILQHEIYSWEVVGKSFVPMEEITVDSRFLNLTIKNWANQMTVEERNQVVDTLYALLNSGDVKTAADIFHPRNVRRYIRAVCSDDGIRKLLSGELKSLMAAAKKAREQFEETKRAESGSEE